MLRRFLPILLLFPLIVNAQVTAPLSNAVRITNYPVTSRHDRIFIFCASSSNTGTLEAAVPKRTGPFTFTWTKYDPTAGDWTIPVKTENGSSSKASGLTEGGYCISVDDGLGFDTLMYAWVNIDNPVANAALKHYTCNYVALDGTAGTDNFIYNDPSTGAQVNLRNAVRFNWSSSPETTIQPGEIDPIITKPPLVDVTYLLQVTDSFGCVSSSSFPYKSIHVDAVFVAEPSSGEAPLEVTFTNNSVRAFKCTWDFGDDSISYLLNPPPHKYYIPGTYTVTLTIESELFCTDTYSTNIEVEKSKMVMPNVFSPNDDGMNDYFIPDLASLKYVSLQIFSKSGERVYKFEASGEAVSQWKGWDGKINNSERYAEPGVYYYVIKGKGWDDKEYYGTGFRGVVYLFR